MKTVLVILAAIFFRIAQAWGVAYFAGVAVWGAGWVLDVPRPAVFGGLTFLLVLGAGLVWAILPDDDD